jgi:hypothetical protein
MVKGPLTKRCNLVAVFCQAMSEEQLSALLAKLKNGEGLQEKFKGAASLDAAVSLG